jgi:hypothetical protein
MRASTLAITVFLTAAVGLFGAEQGGPVTEPPPVKEPVTKVSEGPSGEAWTDCPAESVRGPLNLRRAVWNQRGVPIVKKSWPQDVRFLKPVGPFEDAKRIIYASDAYPRKAAKLVGEPKLTKKPDGTYRIDFALDGYDDVMVRVVDKDGKSIRNLGCGVLGPNAPEPFAKNSLKQTVVWDGRDRDGQAAAPGWRVEVGVGLEPKFAGFVAYDKAQLTPYLNALDVDSQGRVYVGLHTDPERNDPVMLRFDRDGKYLDMVYPSNPANLAAMGKTLEDVYPLVERIEGKALPVWGPLWRARIFRWAMYHKLPFVIDRNSDRALFIESRAPFSHRPDPDAYVGANIYKVDDLDHFWFEPPYASGVEGSFFMLHNLGPVAVDKQGMVYLSVKRGGLSHGYTRLDDRNAYGTIVKIDPATRQAVRAFSWLGEEKLDKPRYYLGEPGDFNTWLKNDTAATKALETLKNEFNETRFRSRIARLTMNGLFDRLHYDFYTGKIDSVPAWMAGSPSVFTCVQDLTFDDDGNIFVMDGVPPRIKMYTREGQWKGEVTGLTIGGKNREFFDGIGIKHGNGAFYVLASFMDDKESAYLVKCRDLLTEPKVVWAQKLDKRARFIAVDEKVSPALVWVGNGAGEATVTRVTDSGDKPGEVWHIGGMGEKTLVDPWIVAAQDDGRIFAYDHSRHQIVGCTDDGGDWRATAGGDPNQWNTFCELRRQFIPSGADNANHNTTSVASLVVDPVNRRLLATFTGGTQGAPGGGYGLGGVLLGIPKNTIRHYAVHDYELNPLELQTGPTVHWGDIYWCDTDRAGGIYEAGLASGRFNNPDKHMYVGSLNLRNPDGTLKSEGVVKSYLGTGSMTTDSRGNIYVSDLENVSSHWFGELTFSFPNWGMYEGGEESTLQTTCWFRGDHPVTHLPEVSYLVKFGPEGGDRGTDGERWAHRGAGSVGNVCACKGVSNMLACDGEDRILAAVADHYAVRVIDSAGNLIQRFGCYGNAETAPEVGGSAKGLGFREINNLSAAGDATYVVDKTLRRIAKVKMEYRETKSVHLE